MSREQTDTNSDYGDDIANGTYDFEVVRVDRKNIKDKIGYEWKLEYKGKDGADIVGKQLLWPNQLGKLLSILGCKETEKKGVYEWDTDFQQGKTFTATVSHEIGKKDPSKTYQMMDDFKESKNNSDDISF